MSFRSARLAIGWVLLLAAANFALAGEPIYDRSPGHPWDEARDVFYARRFPTGETFEHPHAFAPPWAEFLPFVHDPAFHERVLGRLKAVEALPPAQMEEQSAARRLIFLRDLWPVLDGLHHAHVAAPDDPKRPGRPSLAALNCCGTWRGS